ncbi:MAG: Type secretion system domain protein [Firmicutes bacterium]|nr:Type secretion system domain protein [Bacillota bacterium]
MVILIAVLASITIFLLGYLFLSAYVPAQGAIEMRLKALETGNQGRSDIDEELAKPFSKRILSPVTKSLAETFMRLAPQSLRRSLEERMVMAGGFGQLSVDEFFLLCGFLAVCLPGVIGLLLIVSKVPANKVVGLSMIFFVIGLIIPIMMLAQKIAARKLSIQKDLPDVLDLLTVSVEAGLGFDGALAKLTEKMKGALVDEFNRVLQEIRMGVSRRDALASLGIRCAVSDLSMFTTSLIQADQLGVSIGNVLRVQSASMREKRKQQAEEKAMKAPIKMMLPLVLFIFPTIFIVLLGPAVIQIAKTFADK